MISSNLTGFFCSMIHLDLSCFHFMLSPNELSPDDVGSGAGVVEGRGVVVVGLNPL